MIIINIYLAFFNFYCLYLELALRQDPFLCDSITSRVIEHTQDGLIGVAG